MRLFIAINFNDATINRLRALCDELRSHSGCGNFCLPENLHLTLAFLGECDAKQTAAVKSAMDKVSFEPFDLLIERIGRFKRNGGEIWWAGVRESKVLLELQCNLAVQLVTAGFVVDTRKYSPHITLGREIITNIGERMLTPFGENVIRIDLMKSERINSKLTYTAIYNKGCSMENFTQGTV